MVNEGCVVDDSVLPKVISHAMINHMFPMRIFEHIFSRQLKGAIDEPNVRPETILDLKFDKA